jgi:hypothetical protein
MLLDWCARWLDGRTIWGKPTNKPNGIYYLAADRGWETYERILARLGTTELPLHPLSVADLYGGDANLQGLLKESKHGHEAFLYCFNKMQVPAGAHLIVEPFTLFVQGDINKMRDVIISLLKLRALCQSAQINITASLHFAKQRQEATYLRHQDKIAGSTAFAGYTDTQIVLVPPSGPKEPWYTLGWNPRDSEPEEFKATRDDRGLFVPYLVAFGEAEQRVYAFIPAPPESITRAQIIERSEDLGIPIHSATLDRALRSLLELQRIVRLDRGTYSKVVQH